MWFGGDTNGAAPEIDVPPDCKANFLVAFAGQQEKQVACPFVLVAGRKQSVQFVRFAYFSNCVDISGSQGILLRIRQSATCCGPEHPTRGCGIRRE